MLEHKKLFIVYERFYDFSAKRIVSGGVQTYLVNLIPLFLKNGYEVHLFQCGQTHNYIQLNGYDVTAVKESCNVNNGKYLIPKVLNVINSKIDKEKDVLLFADSCCIVKNRIKTCIAIQHGISWDIPRKKRFSDPMMALYSAYKTYKEHAQLKNVSKLICVDYNFINWYKAQVDEPQCPLLPILNFTQIPPVTPKNNQSINIIFARRFVKHRGTRVFSDAIYRVLQEYDNVSITIAGRGPDENYIHTRLQDYSDRIKYIQYSTEESLHIHQSQDIAVVPTVGSEGTSLSLLEAMAAQCAVVCTSVGGMTNIVLDGYNGVMIQPDDVDALYEAIKFLIDHEEDRKTIATNGYNTVKKAFSYEKWAMKWDKVIQDI